VVFVTERYVQNVASEPDDSCKVAFFFAMRLLGPDLLIPVVMEERMADPSKWTVALGLKQQPPIVVKMWEDSDVSGAGLERLIEEILKRVPAWRSEVKPSGVERAAPAHGASKGKQ
jgi:hypothetical protein